MANVAYWMDQRSLVRRRLPDYPYDPVGTAIFLTSHAKQLRLWYLARGRPVAPACGWRYAVHHVQTPCMRKGKSMPSEAQRLTPAAVLMTVVPLLQRRAVPDHEGQQCAWCHGPAVWTTGNKTRCTVCGFVPS